MKKRTMNEKNNKIHFIPFITFAIDFEHDAHRVFFLRNVSPIHRIVSVQEFSLR